MSRGLNEKRFWEKKGEKELKMEKKIKEKKLGRRK